MWQKRLVQERIPDLYLLTLICCLVILGMFMVYSSSHIWSEYKYGDSFFYVKRQMIFTVVGIICMFMITYISYINWKRYVNYILVSCFILLIIVLIPGIGIVRGGAQSWIGIGAFSIQPSEFVKLSLIIFIAERLTVYGKKITSFFIGFFPLLLLIFLAFTLIMFQPDLGTGVVLVLTCMFIIFIAGAQIKHF